MDVEQITTADGSVTLRDVERDLAFRSTHGARTESRHVFVEPALRTVNHGRTRILEFGFGGAMNFCETSCAAREHGFDLDYVAVERDPVEPRMLCHPDERALEMAREALANPGTTIERDGATLCLHVADWRDAGPFETPFDALYHDPFGPRDAPDGWTDEVFRLHLERARPRALLATYSAATRVRRAMARAGFYVAKRPGPGRKREVTVASADKSVLAPYEIAYAPEDLAR